MPDPQTCEWEWDGKKWTQLSGPSSCPAPPDPRAEPGEKTTSVCPPSTGGVG